MSNKEYVKGFRIVCDVCYRKMCNFQFTEDNDIVIYCRSCGQTEIIFKDKIKGTTGRSL